MQEKIDLQNEKNLMRGGGATITEVREHFQKEKAHEQKAVRVIVTSIKEDTPPLIEKTMSIMQARGDNLLEHYRKLMKNEWRTTDPEEKLFLSEEKFSILREFDNLAAHILYTEMSGFSSQNSEAVRIKSEIQDIFDNELAQIKESADTKTDPGTLALLRTRDAELEKMKAELEIRWIEKKMYDLHVDWSPEKETLSQELQTIINERLNPIIREYVSALNNERNILLKRGGTPERSTRLSYVNGRLVEFEGRAKKSKTSGE